MKRGVKYLLYCHMLYCYTNVLSIYSTCYLVFIPSSYHLLLLVSITCKTNGPRQWPNKHVASAVKPNILCTALSHWYVLFASFFFFCYYCQWSKVKFGWGKFKSLRFLFFLHYLYSISEKDKMLKKANTLYSSSLTKSVF